MVGNQDQAADAPAEALPEIVRLVEEMLVGRGYDLENPVVEEIGRASCRERV